MATNKEQNNNNKNKNGQRRTDVAAIVSVGSSLALLCAAYH